MFTLVLNFESIISDNPVNLARKVQKVPSMLCPVSISILETE